MTLRNIFTAALLLTFLITKGQTCNTFSANKFIKDLFGDKSYISYDSTRFLSFASSKTTPINTPLLKNLLPEYCFFSTEFESSYYEYREVETVIALRLDSTSKSIITHSPVFTQENKSFIQLFYNLNIRDNSSKIEVCKEIAAIFSSITYKGHINQLMNLKNQNVISFELWHDDLSWRIYDFHFDNDSLVDIEIKGGVKRGKMDGDYKRI